jgi:hypothetical protein
MALTLEEKRQALIRALRKDADLHEKGLFKQLGSDFDQLDVEANGVFEDARVQQAFGIAWNLWDSWLDESNHCFPGFYEGIAKDHWPAIARQIAENLEDGNEVIDPLLLRHFVLYPTIPFKERMKQLWPRWFSDK